MVQAFVVVVSELSVVFDNVMARKTLLLFIVSLVATRVSLIYSC